MEPPGFVTEWSRRLADPDARVRDEAAQMIWEHYAPRLLTLIRGHLSERVRQREDEDDVLQSLFKSFFDNQRHGRYSLGDRNEVWGMLFRIAMRKVADAAGRHTAGCRDIRREQPGAVRDSTESRWVLDHVAASEPSPEEIAAVEDELALLLRLLPEELRQIVYWKLEGHTNREIASMLRRTERSVEMKLQRIRQKWIGGTV